MVNKKIGVRLIILLLGTILATACTQSYSQAPAATPTLIPAGLFVSPLPTGVDAMQLVADFGTQTAEALSGTTVASWSALELQCHPGALSGTTAPTCEQLYSDIGKRHVYHTFERFEHAGGGCDYYACADHGCFSQWYGISRNRWCASGSWKCSSDIYFAAG